LSPATLLLLCWALFCLLFFSTSQSKLPGYALPAIPAIGLLLARSYVRFSFQSEKGLRWLLTTYAAVSLPVGVSLIAVGKAPRALIKPGGEILLAVGCVVLAFGLANFSLTLKSRFVPATAFCVIPVLLLILLFRPLSRPFLRWDPSGRTLAAELVAARISQDQIYVAGIKRGQLYSLSFYLRREIEPWNQGQTDPGYLLVRSRRCRDIVGPSMSCEDTPIELGRSGWFAYRVQQKPQ